MSKKCISGVEQLIDVVKEYPIVYSRSGTVIGVVNNNEKNNAWIEIGKRLNDDPNKLKQKWRNLRDSYHKAIKYKKDLEEIGQLQKYHAYRHEKRMEFLLPHVLADIPNKRKRHKTYEDDDDCKPEKIDKKEECISYALESQDVEYLVEDIVFSDLKRSEDCDTIIYKDSHDGEDIEQSNNVEILDTESNICYEEVESATDLPEHDASSSSPLDELDLWLSSVKSSLIKLTKINRARAKRDINTILSNYEIEQYEAEDN